MSSRPADPRVKFRDLREYLARDKYELSAIDSETYLVYRHIPPNPPYRRQYKRLYNALIFNGFGSTEEDIVRRFDEWRLKRFMQERTP